MNIIKSRRWTRTKRKSKGNKRVTDKKKTHLKMNQNIAWMRWLRECDDKEKEEGRGGDRGRNNEEGDEKSE